MAIAQSGQAGGIQPGVSALQTTIGYTPPATIDDATVTGGYVVAETLTATTIVAAATAVPVQAASIFRKTLGVVNTGAADAWFGWSSAVTAATGWPLYASGGGYTWGLGEAPPATLYVFSTAGTTIIAKQGT